jgi:acetoacetate decarboxylase
MAKKRKSKKSGKGAKATKGKKATKSKKATKKKSAGKTGAASGKKPIQGKLTKADFGYSMPVDQPLYPAPPIEYKDSTILTYTYETDPDAAAAILPAPLCLTETPTVKMVFATYGWSSVGFYNEVVQALSCTYNGTDYVYAVRLHVTTDKAMSSGREIGGFPKKIGHIEFNAGAEIRSHLESPLGSRVCSAVMIPGQKITPPEFSPSKYVSLRVIPDPTDSDNPSICELLASDWELGPGDLWTGVGNVHLYGSSEMDPYHKLPVVNANLSPTNPLPCAIYRGDMKISNMTLLKKL